MYSRYIGNTGKRIRVPEPEDAQPQQRGELSDVPAEKRAPPSPQKRNGNGGGKLESSSARPNALFPALPFGMDTGDLLLITVLLLLYRESGDTDFLIILAVVAASIIRDQPL